MPTNAVQRLQKIENDLKTVISIYEVSKRENSKRQYDGSQLPQINTREVLTVQEPSQFDFSKNTFQDATESVQGRENPKLEKSPPLSYSALSTTCEVSYVKAEDSGNRAKPEVDVVNNYSSAKYKKGKENRNLTAVKRSSVSSGDPDWLIRATSNWFGSVKRSNNRKTLIDKNMPKTEEKNRTHLSGIVNEKGMKCKRFDEKEKVRHYQGYNNQKTRKEVDDGELCPNELSKMIEKSKEKLEKMKASKDLALDIAKHLKEKYDEVQQSKRELVEALLKVQKDNETVRKELQDAQMEIEELKQSKTTQIEQEIKNKETIEENVKKQKARICELEKELIERQKDIENIERARLTEVKNKENQARDIQRLSNEKCQLLATNDELVILLTDSQVEKQFLEQRIHQLEDEVQMQKQHLIKKTKALQETNTELESVRQSSTDLEDQVKMLRKNIENFEQTQKDFTKRAEEYEHHVKMNQEEINKLQDENIKLKTDLENEKDALLIKTKIIEDQQESIKQLKEKLDDEKKRKESLDRILNTEREEKLELEEALERLKWRKEELKKKIKALESDLLSAPQKVAEDLQKTQKVLFELENQFYSKQKEWELQLHSLIREKEQACNVAEYATRKLIQTNSEFQKQSEAHRKLCRILTENLAEK